MLQRTLVLLTLLLAVVASGTARAQDDYKAKPLPAGPEAYTQQRYLRDRTAFWSAALVAEVKTDPANRAEWSTPLDALMLGMAELWLTRNIAPEQVTRLRKAAATLRELGCTHPLVAWAVAYMDFTDSQHEAARAWFENEVDGIRARLASQRCRYVVESSVWEFVTFRQKQATADGEKPSLDLLGALATSAEFGDGHERFYFDLLNRHFGDPSANNGSNLDNLDKIAGKPNYGLLVRRAEYHMKAAWAARGTGTAASIGDREREAFLTHVEAAMAAASKAHELWPRHPEAPAAMISSLGVVGGGEANEMRAWFDRAVAAQFDWLGAYTSYLHYLQPRWGGSVRELQKFAQDCADTARFDTQVPGLYRRAIYYISLDQPDRLAAWTRSAVAKRLEALDAGYTAAARNELEHETADIHRIVRLTLAGKAEDAAAEHERKKPRGVGRILEQYGLAEDWLNKTLRPHMRNYRPATIAARDVFAGFETAAFRGHDKAVPLTTNARASTAWQTRGKLMHWFGDAFVQAYAKAGVHDAAWDAEARELQAAFGCVLFDAIPTSLGERAAKLLETGCKDPLTLYVATRLGAAHETASRTAKRMATIVPAVEKDHQPALAWWTEGYYYDVAHNVGRNDIAAGLVPRFRANMVQSAAGPQFAGERGRLYVRLMFDPSDYAPTNPRWLDDAMVEQLSQLEGVDPWLRHVVNGLHIVTKVRRSPGTASQRNARLRTAAEHFGKAHELHPDRPEAATGMIIVASWSRDTELTPREWFDRAVAAEIDFEPAYRAFVDSLRPRVGGSIQAMHRFAVECLDSGRFDTEVPLWYAWTLRAIQEEHGTPRAAWAATGVGKRLDRMFAGYLAKGSPKYDAAFFHSGRCLTAWAGGRYDDAVNAFGAAGRTFDARWLPIVGVVDPELVEIDLKAAAQPRPK